MQRFPLATIEPHMFCSIAFDPIADDMVIVGIFTNKADADQHLAETLKKPQHCNSGCVTQMTMAAIKRKLVHDLMAEASDALDRLVAKAIG